jgi:hypothetical protein
VGIMGIIGIKPSDQRAIRTSMQLTISPNLLFLQLFMGTKVLRQLPYED